MSLPIPLIVASDFIDRRAWDEFDFPLPDLDDAPRILILKLSAIGDCLVASPVARALRQRYPRAFLAWAVQSKAAAVVEGNPHLDEVIVWKGGSLAVWQIVREVRARRFDVVLDLQGALKSAPIVALCGAPHRVVSSRAEAVARRFASMVVPMPTPPPHAGEQYLRLAQILGISPHASRALQMPISDVDRAWARAFLAENGFDPARKMLALNPGAARAIKQWPPPQFARLGALAQKIGVQLLILGGPNEVELAQQIAHSLPFPPIFAAGKTNLKQLGALLERCDLLVSADTGPMHICAGVGTPILGLFGPTDPRRTGPIGEKHTVVMQDLPCRPCLQKPICERFECLTELEGEQVWEVARMLLFEKQHPRSPH